MPAKKLSDMVFQRVNPPDYKKDVTLDDLADVLVRRLGFQRKKSIADHSKFLLTLLKYKKENIPLEVNEIAEIMGIKQSQAYEEIRKWRTLGVIEYVKMAEGDNYSKGYMLTGNTINRVMDKVESSFKSFMRETRRIAKDFDDIHMIDAARKEKQAQNSENTHKDNDYEMGENN